MCSKTISTEEDQRVLQEDLDSLPIWDKRCSMSFHPQKCKRCCQGHDTENVITTKYLGVNIQYSKNWTAHINTITNKANKTLGFLRRNLKTGNKKTKETAYKALVRPSLE